MEVIITIFKQQLAGNPELKRQLAHLSLEVKELSAALLYVPSENTLAEFISLLNQAKISFGAHAPKEEMLDLIRGNGLNKTGN